MMMIANTVRNTVAAAVLGCLALLGGCATAPATNPSFAPVADPSETLLSSMRKPVEYRNGSIFSAGHDIALFEDVKARHVGDILTIVLDESTNASKSASTSTSKSTDFSIANPTVFGRAGNIKSGKYDFSAELGADREFSGEGDSSQSNSLTGSVSVIVTEVLSNGNLRVEGQKVLTINQGDEQVRLAGIVRPTDIRSDNSVLSAHVANAHFVYAGTGVIADANTMGWLARFFNSGWWPF